MKYAPEDGKPQLFDLKKDPTEKNNLATKNLKRVKELSALLDEWYVPEQRTMGKVSPVTTGPKAGNKPNRKQKNK
jgi:uncharacterized sulfatase